MQNGPWREILNWIGPDVLATASSIFGMGLYVGLGRLAHYVNIEKRVPTFKESLKDIILITFMGVLASGFLEFVDVKNLKVIGGASALFGYFGPKSIHIVLKIALKKLGYEKEIEFCDIQEITEKSNKSDKPK